MTIGYNCLGSNGRLGNQMFQYAGLRGIAAHKKYDWVIPNPINYGSSNYGLFDCFEMSSVYENNFGMVDGQYIQTGSFNFNKEFFDNCPNNVSLHDYFQTERYFENIAHIIRKDFSFNKKILDPCLEIIQNLNNPIFIHIRRGDYVNQPDNHPICPLSYYKRCLELFDKDCSVLVFSDDLDWCRENFIDDRFLIPTENPVYSNLSDTNDGRVRSFIPYYDLCMMSMCSGAIIANSSLSWWGAWLIKNPTQPIFTPSPWFGKNYNHYDMSDLIPARWIIQNV